MVRTVTRTCRGAADPGLVDSCGGGVYPGGWRRRPARELCDTAGMERFSDVDAGDYAADYVACMRALGLSQGRAGRQLRGG